MTGIQLYPLPLRRRLSFMGRILCRLGWHDWTGVEGWFGPEVKSVRFCECSARHEADVEELKAAQARCIALKKSKRGYR